MWQWVLFSNASLGLGHAWQQMSVMAGAKPEAFNTHGFNTQC